MNLQSVFLVAFSIPCLVFAGEDYSKPNFDFSVLKEYSGSAMSTYYSPTPCGNGTAENIHKFPIHFQLAVDPKKETLSVQFFGAKSEDGYCSIFRDTGLLSYKLRGLPDVKYEEATMYSEKYMVMKYEVYDPSNPLKSLGQVSVVACALSRTSFACPSSLTGAECDNIYAKSRCSNDYMNPTSLVLSAPQGSSEQFYKMNFRSSAWRPSGDASNVYLRDVSLDSFGPNYILGTTALECASGRSTGCSAKSN